MAAFSKCGSFYLVLAVLLCCAASPCSATRKLTELVPEQTQLLRYHNGPLLYGPISVNLIWYGRFTPSQRGIISDFVASLSTTPKSNPKSQPSVAEWWKTTDSYLSRHRISKNNPLSLALGNHISDESYSLGKKLSDAQILALASKGGQRDAINVVLTSSDVVVERFCSSRCGTHSSGKGSAGRGRFAYIWVGNSETQCPGQCAWPFHQPIYGPQSTPLVAPNGDVGVDGMVINLASLLAATATNPFGNGYFQGPAEAPLEAGSACPGVYGSGAYPGYAGNLLVDSVTGSSFNAHGANGRKFLLPALYDPSTSTCSTLV